ncbi:MAG: leucine zipper domain-containing protein, partial [Actinomycetota bacterium]
MDHARYLVDAVVVEGRSLRTVARAHGVSKSWVAVLVKRYRTGGYDALTPKSKRPHTSPQRITPERENAIITLRKELLDTGLDAGATTIAWHLQRQGFAPPSVST